MLVPSHLIHPVIWGHTSAYIWAKKSLHGYRTRVQSRVLIKSILPFPHIQLHVKGQKEWNYFGDLDSLKIIRIVFPSSINSHEGVQQLTTQERSKGIFEDYPWYNNNSLWAVIVETLDKKTISCSWGFIRSQLGRVHWLVLDIGLPQFLNVQCQAWWKVDLWEICSVEPSTELSEWLDALGPNCSFPPIPCTFWKGLYVLEC